MCGIGGFTRLGEAGEPGVARRIVDSLYHRGPDQQGIFEGCVVTLCAVRLRVVDLAGGDQPLVSADGNTVLVFNGEIYNHFEIRAELEPRGHRFQSRSDTETVLAAYLEWGTECFARFRGMFGLAVWEEREQRLVLARDRMGIKPLYYCQKRNDIYFGSELKAILSHSQIPRQLDLEALGYYLSLNYVPGPHTLIDGIRKLLPGHYLEWKQGQTRIERWWQFPALSPRRMSLASAKEKLDWLLRESVREHLAADVPLGVWASGGLDSSTILHYASTECSTKLKTFSISFAGRRFDESTHFRRIARAYGTDHYEFDLGPDLDLSATVEALAFYSDEPSADAGALPVWYLSQLTRKTVTVALSGEGADEMFGGYITYLADRACRWFQMVPRYFRRGFYKALDHYVPVSDEKISLEYKVKRWTEGSCLHPDEAHFFWNGTFSPEQARQICPSLRSNILRHLVTAVAKHTRGGILSRYLTTDQNYYLADDILYKTDRMSMAHSLEVRPPFLDHRIVEFAAEIPETLKVRGLTQKRILKELMKDKLPQVVIERKKAGFDIPAHDWLRGALRELLLDTLNPIAISATGIFDARAIQALIRDHMERRSNAGYHLWGLLTLFLWMKRWKVESLPDSETRIRDQVFASN